MLATYLMQQNYPFQVTAADGALVGLLAGAMGGVLGTLISIPMDAMMAPFMRQVIERLAANPDIPAETRTMIARGNPNQLRDECPDPKVQRFLRRGEPAPTGGRAL